MKMLHGGGGGLEFYNFALGSVTSIQNFYEAKRKKDVFANAELIITNSNSNDLGAYNNQREKLPLNILYRNLYWFYQELYFLNTKVIVFMLPYRIRHDAISNIHKVLCFQFGFNYVDFCEYYEKQNLEEFKKRFDGGGHQFPFIMREFGKNIIKNIDNFKKPKELNIINDNPKFEICTPKDMELVSGELQEIPMKNSMYDEKTYRLDKSVKLKFPERFRDYLLIAMHTWNTYKPKEIQLNFADSLKNYSSLKFTNKDIKLSKECNFLNSVLEVHNNFIIDNETIASFNEKDDATLKEYHHAAQSYLPDAKKANYCNLISFFLASPNGNYHNETIDFEALANENIQIPKEYDFNHLIPPVELYKEIIDEYCARMDPRKLAPLQKQISEKDNLINSLNQEKQKLEQDKNQQIQVLTNEKNSLQNEKSSLQTQISKLQNEPNSIPTKKANLEVLNLEQELKNKKLEELKIKKELGEKFIQNITLNLINANSAKARIQNHLSYKLGQVMIRNSKSIFGYIKIPYILMAITIAHKEQNKNLKLAKDKLPSLESYPDYEEALKEKECFTYKLGEAFIKAHKNWYKGGYLKFYFKDMRKLKGEFGKQMSKNDEIY